ncbi:MAG: sigma-70 family RNA polymerase sigma factor [Candidatus Poribacteria bacterium]|nr:sigma-70 family RNA polymerase sigma factor [Candidatus Poribacteria bacterium]
MVEEDVQLIHRILSGDEEAFTALVRKHQKSVHALAWRTIGDFHHAEEVMQDTFLQVYRKLSTLKDPRQFSGWLYVITHRCCLNWLRKNKSAIQVLETTTMEAFDKSAYSRYISEQRESEFAADRQNLVKKLLDKLPESERTVMTLYYLGEMKTKEISRFLGVSVNTITSRLNRARQRLQQEEELLIQEMFRSVQLSENLIEDIVRKVVDLKPTSVSTGKPLLPWAAFSTAMVLIALMLGVSNQNLIRFQRPYSFDAASEPTIVIIDAPIILETDAKPAIRNQIGLTATISKNNSVGLQDPEGSSTPNASEDPFRLSQTQWMPDENLRRVIKSELKLGDTPLEVEHLQHLNALISFEDGIESIQGLEHAINLRFLHLAPSRISDLTPLANLHNLRTLKLYENRVVDVSPLAALVGLETLHLQDNQIVDISPLAGFVNLKDLQLHNNRIEDFSQLAELINLQILKIHDNVGVDISSVPSNLTEFLYDQTSNIQAFPIRNRITDRKYPSVFAAWHNIINRPTLSWDERLVYHDLYFCWPMSGLGWRSTPIGMNTGMKIFGEQQLRDKMLKQNPNMIFLVGIYYYGANPNLYPYPDDWKYWLRDESGNRIPDKGWGELLIDYTLPGAQDLFVRQVLEIAEYGISDGIFLDWWQEDKALESFYNGDRMDAKISILQKIREEVSEDFLIIVNAHLSKIPRSATYANGAFMKTEQDKAGGYTHQRLREIEGTLLWTEENFRYPQINTLEGQGIETEPLDSPKNQQWMRVFTTLSLTHSNGYVSYVTGISSLYHTHHYPIWEGHSEEHARGEPHDHTHQHYWYDFWDADLGQPVSGKGQLYHGRNGLFIREFSNGWAVYNRSGKEQQIQLPMQATGVASGITDTSHVVPDLDGEIFVK